MSLIFGDRLERAAQYIVGVAYKIHTPQALENAALRLEGISTLLTFMGGQTTDVIRLQNEIVRCRLIADELGKGKAKPENKA